MTTPWRSHPARRGVEPLQGGIVDLRRSQIAAAIAAARNQDVAIQQSGG